jgi:uncharacterized protein with HEPN domain
MKDDRLYLIHISESIARIEEYVGGGEQEFMASTLIQDAVVRNLQTLAESAKRLSVATQAQHPEIPWRKVIGFRNVLVHDYLSVDVPKIWEIVARELPALKQSITAMLAADDTELRGSIN